jgi:hypothetical protein
MMEQLALFDFPEMDGPVAKFSSLRRPVWTENKVSWSQKIGQSFKVYSAI